MVNEDKLTVFNILKKTGFFSMKNNRGLESATMRDALYNLSNEFAKIQNPTLPAIGNVSNDLQGEGVKIIIPSNIIDIYTRLEVLLGLSLSGYTDAPKGANNLIDELYERGELQNEQQYRNDLSKFHTQ